MEPSLTPPAAPPAKSSPKPPRARNGLTHPADYLKVGTEGQVIKKTADGAEWDEADWLPLSGGTLSGNLTIESGSLWLRGEDCGIWGSSNSSELNFVVNGTEVLKVNGGSVSLPTGLTISGVRTPTSDSEAANKQYVDTQLSTKLTQEVADTRYLQLGGGTINGTLKFNNGMGEENYASIYSDKSAMFIDIPGGEVYIGSAGRSDDIVVTRGYIDDVLSGYLPLSGGTLTGDIHIKSNASDEESDYAWIYNEKGTLTLESASGYVDLHVKTPIYDDQPANKAYVDSHPVYHAGTSAPSNTNLLWIDTNATTGGLKYYNGSSWVHVPVAYS